MNDTTLARLRETPRTSRGVTPWDPSSVFIVKSLLYPLVATASLGAALWLCEERFHHAYFLIAVLGFLGTADFIDVAPLQRERGRSVLLRGLVPIAMHWCLVVGAIWLLLQLSDLTPHFNRQVMLTWLAITPFALWLSRLAAPFALQFWGARHAAPRQAVIIGRNDLGLLLRRRLHAEPSLRIRVLGFFDDRSAAGMERLLGEPAALAQFIVQNNVQVVYITWPMAREARILALLESLRDSTASIYFVPDLSVASLIQGRMDLINGMPVVGICESPFYGIRGLAKRLCDLALASLLVILLSPVLLAVTIGVRCSSPGPVLFKQRRYGLDGKQITVYKFRSMSVTEDGEHHYTQVIRNDTRVTGFGAFIRRTSLDELPQLFNVLEGSMSLVGPRPHAIAVNEQYRRLISGYMIRHKVKPGITGWAQINGLRGGDDLDSMRRRIEFDLEYLRNWSLGLDLAIVLRTLWVVWADRRAY